MNKKEDFRESLSSMNKAVSDALTGKASVAAASVAIGRQRENRQTLELLYRATKDRGESSALPKPEDFFSL